MTEEKKQEISLNASNQMADMLFLIRMAYHVNELQKNERIVLPDEKLEQLFQRLLATYNYLVYLKFLQISIIETYLYAHASYSSFKENRVIKGWVDGLI